MNGKSFKRGNETNLTYGLKWAAWEWLYTVGRCRCIGMEVRLEGPGGRVVDLAGVGPENTVYIIEVKASLADFYRDNHTPEDLAELKSRAPAIDNRLRLARDTLVQATAFAQLSCPEKWLGVTAYRQALADCRRIDQERDHYLKRLSTYSAKFHDPAFLAIADYHYIMAPGGMISRRKAPPAWGLLNPDPSIVVPAPRKDIRKSVGIVSNILRAIARVNTTSMMHAAGVQFTEDGPVFPET